MSDSESADLPLVYTPSIRDYILINSNFKEKRKLLLMMLHQINFLLFTYYLITIDDFGDKAIFPPSCLKEPEAMRISFSSL